MITDNNEDRMIKRDRMSKTYSFEQTHCSENRIRNLVLEFSHVPLKSQRLEKKENNVSK